MKNNFFKIGKKYVGKKGKVFIVAEVGVNHEGSFNKCTKLFEKARESGADAVKLQTVDVEKNYVQGTASYKEFKNTDFTNEEFYKLSNVAKKLGLSFFTTPGDFESVDKCKKYGSQAIKISSGLITHLPLIEYASKKKLPIIISTGMAYEEEIKKAFNSTKNNNSEALLKCTSLYPASDCTLNVRGILNLKKKYKIPIGFSDHSLDDLSAYIAVSNGASIIEKHFTLNKRSKGKDHAISMEPKEFKVMCSNIRRIENIQGKSLLKPTNSEKKLRTSRHRTLIANRYIKKNEIFNLNNIGFKRSKKNKKGLKPIYFKKILGKKNKKKIKKNHPIKLSNI